LNHLRILNKLELSRIVAVGDSLDHDILGASNFGIDSILISNGIHKDLFKNNFKNRSKKHWKKKEN
jgi:Predicted sugar phosphatases of the HAD superfamily